MTDAHGTREPLDEDDALDDLDRVDDEEDWLCAGGCGYPVDSEGALCGECACEEDGDLW